MWVRGWIQIKEAGAVFMRFQMGGSCGVKWWWVRSRSKLANRWTGKQQTGLSTAENRAESGTVSPGIKQQVDVRPDHHTLRRPSRQGLHIPQTDVCSEDQTGSSAGLPVVLKSSCAPTAHPINLQHGSFSVPRTEPVLSLCLMVHRWCWLWAARGLQPCSLEMESKGRLLGFAAWIPLFYMMQRRVGTAWLHHVPLF